MSSATDASERDLAPEPARGSVLEVLRVFTQLGLTSFGGPIAHLGHMKAELVDRRRWVTEETYADLVALCQFLPGPASSQLGMALGIERAGLAGGLAAWLGFTTPSAVLLVLFALGAGALDGAERWLHGLRLVAVPVVALAIGSMARTLCPDARRATIAVTAACVALAWRSALAQIAIIAVAGLVGLALDRGEAGPRAPAHPTPVRAWQSITAGIVFVALLVGLPVLSATGVPGAGVVERFYRVGALVFGGGHVVLPLLEHEVVGAGWTTTDRFLAGYGAAQAVPGPLFAIAAYLGFVQGTTPTGWLGAAVALIAIFLPSYLLVVCALPSWSRLRASPSAGAALRGTNAAVVGLLIAALYDPVITTSIESRADVAIALAAFLALAVWKLPPWQVVPATALASGLLAGA